MALLESHCDKPKAPILIVDDERCVRMFLQALLEGKGYVTTVAENAAQARLRLKDCSPVLMLCDVSMPGESGLSLAKEVLKPGGQTAVIMITGIDDPKVGRLALEFGVYGYLVKPVGPAQVLIAIENALRRYRLERQAQDYRDHLEQVVAERTDQLEAFIKNLQEEVAMRKRAEEHLDRSHQQLRGVYLRLQSAREEEATRIAREIHDELGQTLTALKMDVSLIGRRLSEERDTSLVTLQGKTESMGQLIDSLIHTVRRIATDLRPVLLDDLGLAAAIEWQGKDFESRTDIPCSVLISAETRRVPRDRATALFRIVQEALTNVVRHANARNVHIRLREEDHQLLLEVQDNGQGMTQKERADLRSLGLAGMQERALTCGGQLDIVSSADTGTTIRARLPIES